MSQSQVPNHDAGRLLEAQVRLHYRFLRHDGFSTAVHCQEATGERRFVGRRVLAGEAGVVLFAKEFNGRGNVFIGRNPRNPDGEVGAISSFGFDIDPDRPKGTAADDAGRARACVVARRIMQLVPGGALLDSGNGYQVLYSWEPEKGVSVDEFGTKSKRFTDGIRAQLAGMGGLVGCSLDAVHDPARLIKLAGTLSTKGERAQWRAARFVGPVPLGGEGFHVFQRILAVDVAPKVSVGPGDARPLSDEVVVAAKALSRLAPRRRDNYHDWLFVGMALRALGDAGLALWDDWSRQGKGYEAGACREKWRTFDPAKAGEGVTLGSLITWAREDQPFAEQADRQSEPDDQPHVGGQEAALTVGPSGYLVELEERLKGGPKMTEFPFGIHELDKYGALLVRGQMTTIGARTNVGKTALAITAAVEAAKGGKSVTFFSTETTAGEVMDRFIANLRGAVPPTDPAAHLTAAKQALDGLRLQVCDSFEPTLVAVEKVLVETKPDLFVFDHVQHAGTATEYRVQELSRFIKGMHDLARKYNAALLMSSQLNRAADTEVPALRHLKECGTLEEESRVVVLLYSVTANVSLMTSPVGCLVAKNKGPQGQCQLLLTKETSRFQALTTAGVTQ